MKEKDESNYNGCSLLFITIVLAILIGLSQIPIVKEYEHKYNQIDEP